MHLLSTWKRKRKRKRKGVETMYESPIKLIETQMKTEIENEIFRAVKSVGVNVDKEELVLALQYDRRQYEKGYADGIEDFIKRLKDNIPNFDGETTMKCVERAVSHTLKEMLGE